MLIAKAKSFLRINKIVSRFSTAPPPAPKKIEMFINDEPYQVSNNLLRLNLMSPFFKQPKKMESRSQDSATMND